MIHNNVSNVGVGWIDRIPFALKQPITELDQNVTRDTFQIRIKVMLNHRPKISLGRDGDWSDILVIRPSNRVQLHHNQLSRNHIVTLCYQTFLNCQEGRTGNTRNPK